MLFRSDDVVRAIENSIADRPVSDGTGLTGTDNIRLVYTPQHPTQSQSARNYFASVGKTFVRHRFQMRSITAKFVWSAFTPSPGVR